MANQFVQMATQSSQKFDAIRLLAALGRFALPDRWPPFQLERDLEARFATSPSIAFADSVTWLAESGIATTSLHDAVIAASSGNFEMLHQVLQQQNDNQILPLLAVKDASKLVELMEGSSRPLWHKAEACLLVRAGYSTDEGFGWYYASLPGDSARLSRLTWSSLVDAVVTDGVGVLPPVDPNQIQESLHIMEQALAAAASAQATAASAHAAIKALLGQRAS